MAQRKLLEGSERVRKVGDRRESITVELTPEEVEAEKTNVVDLLGRKHNLEAARKSLASEYKAKIEAIDTAVDASCRAAQTRKRLVDADIELWLTNSREVISVDVATGKVVARRTARLDELQEALFDERNGAAAELAFPAPDDAFGQ